MKLGDFQKSVISASRIVRIFKNNPAAWQNRKNYEIIVETNGFQYILFYASPEERDVDFERIEKFLLEQDNAAIAQG